MSRSHHIAKLTEARDLLAKLIEDWPEWDARTRAWCSDGYPNGGGEPSSGGAHSDPTVLAVLVGDEIRRDRDEQLARLSELLGIARELNTTREKYMTLHTEPVSPKYRGINPCGNPHGCPDDNWAVKAGRCDACYVYRWRNKRDRTTRTGDAA